MKYVIHYELGDGKVRMVKPLDRYAMEEVINFMKKIFDILPLKVMVLDEDNEDGN